jgi:tRNA A37 threonylcarbamoyladenosine dehydratase
MAARIADISPDIRVDLIDDFVTVDNAQTMVSPSADVVIDAIDAPRAKAAVIALCAARAQPIIVCGAAGGRVDPLALRRADLTDVRGDPLVSSVRARLRREHGFPREKARLFGIEAIWSPSPTGASGRAIPAEGEASIVPGAPLACSGYGSTVMVTAAMGLAAAAWAVEAVSNRARRPQPSRP